MFARVCSLAPSCVCVCVLAFARLTRVVAQASKSDLKAMGAPARSGASIQGKRFYASHGAQEVPQVCVTSLDVKLVHEYDDGMCACSEQTTEEEKAEDGHKGKETQKRAEVREGTGGAGQENAEDGKEGEERSWSPVHVVICKLWHAAYVVSCKLWRTASVLIFKL